MKYFRGGINTCSLHAGNHLIVAVFPNLLHECHGILKLRITFIDIKSDNVKFCLVLPGGQFNAVNKFNAGFIGFLLGLGMTLRGMVVLLSNCTQTAGRGMANKL